VEDPLSLAIGVVVAMLIAGVLALPVHVALRRRIRERSWVIGSCILSVPLDFGAWIAYLTSVPPKSTLPCISHTLPTPGVPLRVECEPIPREIQAALHQTAMLHLAWVLLAVAAGLWLGALVVSLIGRPNVRPPWEPFSLPVGRLST
jgi:hypothetical protein